MDTKSPYSTWFAKNRERVLAYKRTYYASHPEFAQRKREQALARYYAKRGALMKTNVAEADIFLQAANNGGNTQTQHGPISESSDSTVV